MEYIGAILTILATIGSIWFFYLKRGAEREKLEKERRDKEKVINDDGQKKDQTDSGKINEDIDKQKDAFENWNPDRSN